MSIITNIIKALLALNYLLVMMFLNVLYLTGKNKKQYLYLSYAFMLVTMALNMQFNTRYHDAYLPVLMILCINNAIIFKSKDTAQNNYYFMKLLLVIPIIAMLIQFFYHEIFFHNTFFSLISQAIIIFLMFIIFKNNPGQITDISLLNMVSVFSLCNSLLGFAQIATNRRLMPGAFEHEVYREGFRRMYGFEGGANGAGNLGAILMIINLYIFTRKKTGWHLMILIFSIGFMLLTMTRIAYMGAAFGFFTFFILYRDRNKVPKGSGVLKKILIVVMILITFIFSYYTFVTELYDFAFKPRGATHGHRIQQFYIVTELIGDHPFFGIGSGQYSYFLLEHYDKMDLSVHSQWMSIIVEQGIFIFIVFLIFEFSVFLLLFKKYKNDKWFILALFITKTIVSNFNPNQYYFVVNNIFYFTCFGLIFSKKVCDDGEEKETGH